MEERPILNGLRRDLESLTLEKYQEAVRGFNEIVNDPDSTAMAVLSMGILGYGTSFLGGDASYLGLATLGISTLLSNIVSQ